MTTSGGRVLKAFNASAEASIRAPGFDFFDLAIYSSSGDIAASPAGIGFGAAPTSRGR
jgi:hypothetical protein